MFDVDGYKIVGWWMEQEIWRRGILQPPERNNIISFGGLDINTVDEDAYVNVLSENGNWYTIQKKEIHLIDENKEEACDE